MTENISVPWIVVLDGKTPHGKHFKGAMEDLLEAGYPLDVKLSNGKCKTFKSADAFAKWFDTVSNQKVD